MPTWNHASPRCLCIVGAGQAAENAECSRAIFLGDAVEHFQNIGIRFVRINVEDAAWCSLKRLCEFTQPFG